MNHRSVPAIALSLFFLYGALPPLPGQEADTDVPAALEGALPEASRKALDAGEFVIAPSGKDAPRLYDLTGEFEIKRSALPGGANGMTRVECLWKVDSDDEPEALFERIHRISGMGGMEYYSRTRKKMHLLVVEASMIDSKDTTRDVPDPRPEELADVNLFAFRQKDTKFGVNLYTLRSERRDSKVAMAVTNLTDMKVGIVPVIGKGKLTTVFILYRVDSGYLLYSGAFTSTGKGLIPTKEIEESLMNRLKALGTWIFGKDSAITQR